MTAPAGELSRTGRAALARVGEPFAPRSMLDAVLRYLDIALVLTGVPPGSKGPLTKGWNTPANWIDSPERARHHWVLHPHDGPGLIHGPSGTCALDIDNVPLARKAFATLGLDLDAILAQGCRIVGNPARAKAIFAVDAEVSTQLATHKFKSGGVTVFELRGGLVQDCLPPTPHPGTNRPYSFPSGWPGNGLPMLPQDVLELWLAWPETLARLVGTAPALPIVLRPAPAALPSAPSVISEFNARVSRETVMEANGYKQQGSRWLAPTSETGAAGVVLLDGGTVFSHHGADPLADEHAHDAFDCFRILEHGGDVHAAVKAAAAQLGLSKRNGTSAATGSSADVAASAPETADTFTDTGNATRLVALHGDRLHYIPPWGKWLVWNPAQGRWNLDHRDVRVRELAKDVGRALKDAAAKELDNDRAKKIFAVALKTLDSHGISGMVDLARGIEGILLEHEALDRDGWLLGVQNGVLDLHTGTLRRADPRDLMMMQAPVVYDAEAPAPRWRQALTEWFPDETVRAYLQRVAGAALVAEQLDHVFIIHYGGGRNGKGTFVRSLQRVLGPYASVIHLSLLVDQKYPEHDTVKASLFRTRLAVASETQRRVKLDEASVKNLTGGDRIKARRMREDPWEFDPSHSLWLQTNYLPEISGRDRGIWSRIRVVKWEATFDERQQDRHLDTTLADEASGILRWLVEGCLQWQRDGLAEPEAVIRETLAYRQAEDVFSRFCTDTGLAFDPRLKIQAGILQDMLAAWAHDEGIDPPRQDFGLWLKGHYARPRRPREAGPNGTLRQVRYWVGVGLGDKAENADEELPL